MISFCHTNGGTELKLSLFWLKSSQKVLKFSFAFIHVHIIVMKLYLKSFNQNPNIYKNDFHNFYRSSKSF